MLLYLFEDLFNFFLLRDDGFIELIFGAGLLNEPGERVVLHTVGLAHDKRNGLQKRVFFFYQLWCQVFGLGELGLVVDQALVFGLLSHTVHLASVFVWPLFSGTTSTTPRMD